jgi:hypothetical protein
MVPCASLVHPLCIWTYNVNGGERLACRLASRTPPGMIVCIVISGLARRGHGAGMEGVWRCSDVGRATNWYCLTYKG